MTPRHCPRCGYLPSDSRERVVGACVPGSHDVVSARTPRSLSPFFGQCVDHRPSRREVEVRGLLVVAGTLLGGWAA